MGSGLAFCLLILEKRGQAAFLFEQKTRPKKQELTPIFTKRISTAVHNTVMNGERLTPDLGGVGTTTEITDRIIKEL